MSLIKARIVKTMHNRLGFTNVRPAQLVDSLIGILKKTLENGEDILISGFGKFCVKEKRRFTVFSHSRFSPRKYSPPL